MRLLLVLVGAGLRRYSTYGNAMVAGAITNTVYGFLRASVLSAAVVVAGRDLAGYDVRLVVTYAWVTQALIAPVHLFSSTELADRIRSGDIAVDLARPVDLQLQLAVADVGRALAVTVPRAAPPLVVGALTFGLVLPGDPWSYLLGFGSLLLAVGVSFACRFLLNLVAFWLIDIRGPATLYLTLSAFLGGLYVPIAWFPAWLHTLALWTPFPSLVQAPADVLTGRVQGMEALVTLATQAGWLAAAVLLGRIVLRRATRRLVVQGG